jgi:hypothetical protein
VDKLALDSIYFDYFKSLNEFAQKQKKKQLNSYKDYTTTR